MSSEPYTKVGDTYYPKPRDIEVSGNEVKGNWWRVWREAGKYYYEFDAGHFAPELCTVEISQEDFELLKVGKITDTDLTRKYQRT